jgi:lysophospholipase L1-like esterase
MSRASKAEGIRLLAIGDSWQYTGLGKSLATELAELKYRVRADDDDAYCANGKTLRTLAGTDLPGLVSYVANLEGSHDAPKVLLLSCGGNDIAQRNVRDYRATRLFGLLRQGADSAEAALDPDRVHEFVDQELMGYYRAVLRGLTENTRVPILVHGYDRPIPDGRKLAIPFGPGPWLKPVFDAAGTAADLRVRQEVMKTLIDRLNAMIARAAQEFPGQVQHVGFAGVLEQQPGYAQDYRLYWANELHATARGYAALAHVVHRKIVELGVN